MPHETDERLRELEIWKAGMTVEINHIKESLKVVGDLFTTHAEEGNRARKAQRSENRRFLLGVFAVVLTALVGAYFK